jgi:hypothetical protein
MSKRILILTLGLMVLALSTLVIAGTPPGLAGYMPAYYDAELFLINFTELPSGGEAAALAHNSQTNNIYQSDQAVAAGFNFISVLDAIQGDGFNPLWEEVQVVFLPINNPKFQQFTSDNQILAAAAMGEIMLIPTGELYTCSVVGPK